MLAHHRRTHSGARAQPGIHLLNITPYCVDPCVRHAEANRHRDKIPPFVAFRSRAYPIFVPGKQARLFLQDDFPGNLFCNVVVKFSNCRCFKVTGQDEALGNDTNHLLLCDYCDGISNSAQRRISRYVINPYVIISRTLIAIHRDAKLRRTGTIQDNRLVALESLVHLRIRTGQKIFFSVTSRTLAFSTYRTFSPLFVDRDCHEDLYRRNLFVFASVTAY